MEKNIIKHLIDCMDGLDQFNRKPLSETEVKRIVATVYYSIFAEEENSDYINYVSSLVENDFYAGERRIFWQSFDLLFAKCFEKLVDKGFEYLRLLVGSEELFNKAVETYFEHSLSQTYDDMFSGMKAETNMRRFISYILAVQIKTLINNYMNDEEAASCLFEPEEVEIHKQFTKLFSKGSICNFYIAYLLSNSKDFEDNISALENYTIILEHK